MFRRIWPRWAPALPAILLMIPLENQAATDGEAVIDAACYWAHTGIQLHRGECYRLDVQIPPDLHDAWIPVRTLNGWPAPWQQLGTALFFIKRRPFDPWFSLIGTIAGRSPFRIRQSGQLLTAPASGELVCYFNDSPWAYGNNSGCARLRAVKIPSRK